jgi:hypothetical protein
MPELVLILKMTGLVFTVSWVWLKTNAFYEYFFWLPCKFLLKYEHFRQRENLSLVEYLNVSSSSFLVRLITCPSCFILWLSIICGGIVDYTLIPCVYALSLLIFVFICDKKI